MMADETYVGLREAAEHLGVHYMTVYRYVRIGQLPARRDGVTWRVAIEDLDRMRQLERKPSRLRNSRAQRPALLVDRLVVGDESGAWMVVEDALASGTTSEKVYVEILVPALRAIGQQWEEGHLSIAAEHRASTVATRLVGRLGPMFARRGLARGTVVLGAPEGDFHALPSAIVADLLRGRGFDVLDLGANTPASSFVEFAGGASRLLVVLVGATAVDAVPQLTELSRALRSEQLGVPIYFGGGAVSSETVALRLGADGWSGVDADAVVAAVEDIATSSRRTST